MSLLLSIGVVSFANADAGIKSFEISEEEEIRFREEKGIPLPTKEVIPVEKRIVESVQLLNKESKKNKDGSEEIVAYYRPTFKDTKEAKKMLKELENKKNASKITNSELELDSATIGTRSLVPPEEGDFRVYINKTSIDFKDNIGAYNDKYYNYLLNEAVYDFAGLGASTKSGPVIGYFFGLVLDDIEDGHKGSGNAFAMDRTVTKWGQIYTNGSWIDYYHGYQEEIYWEHSIFSYTSDGTQIDHDNRPYYPGNNYMPIIWKPTQNFHDTDEIYSISLNNYLNNTFVYYDGDDHSNLTNDWKTRGQFDYTPQ